MEKLKYKHLIRLIQEKIQVENLFSVILLSFIILLEFLVLVSDENRRFIKNAHIHFFMVFFFIFVCIMQASYRLGTPKRKSIKYKNLKTSEYHQRIIRENILASAKKSQVKSPIGRGRSRYGEVFHSERGNFYTPKSYYDYSDVRQRRTIDRDIYGTETPRSEKYSHGYGEFG